MFKDLVFTGQVRHRRFKQKQHRFAYSLSMFCFDIAEIPETFNAIKSVSIEKLNWFSFYRKNYLKNHSESSMDSAARQLIAEKFQHYPQGKIYLLTQLAALGYCFNPISLYFIFNENHPALDYLILEVSNTPWGETQHYVLASSADSTNNVYRFTFKKELHVSPFMAMHYNYQCTLKLHEKKIILHMENHSNGKKDFDATLTLSAASQNARSIDKMVKKNCLITYKIVAAIYWQALKLWLKGISFYSHPKADKRN